MSLNISVPPSSDEAHGPGGGSAPGIPVDPEGATAIEVVPAAQAAAPAVDPAALTAVDAAAAPAPTPPAEAGPKPTPPAEAGPKLRRKRRVARKRWDAPAWAVSAMIHVGILVGLAAVATTSGEVVKQLANLDSALVANPGSAEELTKIYADPNDAPRESAVGDVNSPTPGIGLASAIGSAPPSSTPRVSKSGRAIGEKTSLPMIPTIAAPGGLQMMSPKLTRDLGGGGMIGGDVTFEAGEIGDALDQVAREILRHLTQHRVTVAWMFDESESMRDDQKEVKRKFDRVVNELKINTPDDVPGPDGSKPKKKSSAPPLAHAIVGFGDDVHFEQEKPTTDIQAIGNAIDRLRIDTTGKENTMGAVAKVIGHYGNLIAKDRKLLIVLVTDESGDDGAFVEEARQAAVSREVPIYIIGRQALFGTSNLRIDYTDPVTKDVYWVDIQRGPETADVEALQYDGIHPRWDEQPSGFAPYELARLAKDTGGIYFLLPSEEGMRVKRREKAYSMSTLKEYVPDYESRGAYLERRARSEFRRTLFAIIAETRSYPFRHHFPVFPNELLPAIAEELPIVSVRLNNLIDIEKRLRSMEKLRNQEPEKRWRAAYDLMLAQVVAYQIKAYEYRANLLEMQSKPPKPAKLPTPELYVAWSLDHSHQDKAPKEKTGKVYAEALRLCKLVIENHPKTPWADLAQDEIDRGFSVQRNEWHHAHAARYEERAKLVPKF